MAIRLSWAKYSRENGVSNFNFAVVDVDRAFAAVRDVEGLIKAGGGHAGRVLAFHEANLSYAAIGFLPRWRGNPVEVERHGLVGELGARYSYSFAYGRDGDSMLIEANVVTEIVVVDEGPGRKEVVLRNITEVTGQPSSCWGVGSFKRETMTSFVFVQELPSNAWSVRFSHNGYDPKDAVDFEGCSSFASRIVVYHMVCPLLLPFLPCSLWQGRMQFHKLLPGQVSSIRDYMNTYTGYLPTHREGHHHRAPGVVRPPEARVVEATEIESGKVQVAIAVVEADGEEDFPNARGRRQVAQGRGVHA